MAFATGSLLYIHQIDFIAWIRAMRRQTGTGQGDYVGIPISATMMSADDLGGEQIEVTFTLCISPDGALAIVRGISELLNGPPPGDTQLPGSN